MAGVHLTQKPTFERNSRSFRLGTQGPTCSRLPEVSAGNLLVLPFGQRRASFAFQYLMTNRISFMPSMRPISKIRKLL